MSNNEPTAEEIEQRKKAIEKHLYELTGNYHYLNQNVDVKLGRRSYAAMDGDHIGVSMYSEVDLPGPQRLRMQEDTTSHETYHVNESDLESKKNFSDKNDVAPKTAGAVINIVEDHYVDNRRTTDFPGQRKSLAYKLDRQIHAVDNPKFHPIDKQPTKEKALVNGLLQVSALGFPVFENPEDAEDISDEILDFLTWARSKVKEVRDMTPEQVYDKDIPQKFNSNNNPTPQYQEALNQAQNAREEVSQEIFDTLMGHIDDPQNADDHVEDTEMYAKEIPDDVDMRPMTDEEKEEFDKMKDDMPTMDMDMDMDMGEQDDDSDQQEGGAGGESGDEAGEEQQEGQSGSGDSNSAQQDDNGNQSGGGSSTPPECPDCGAENVSENNHVVDGMTAARLNAPFNPDDSWVGRSEFISDDELCGFRVEPTGTVPESQLENAGYKAVDVSSGVEILEPKERYDDEETVSGYSCDACGHEWIPGLGGDN